MSFAVRGFLAFGEGGLLSTSTAMIVVPVNTKALVAIIQVSLQSYPDKELRHETKASEHTNHIILLETELTSTYLESSSSEIVSMMHLATESSVRVSGP